jgi:enoyl-CoA hydratase/carnithine racemase
VIVMDAGVGSEVLSARRVGAVAVLVLDRPEARNALNGALVRAIGEHLRAAEADDDVRAIVLTGAGDRAFCAGMDLKEFAEQRAGDDTPDALGGLDAEPGTPGSSPVIPWDYPKPIVAAVNGAAVAGGFELVLSCDLVVAAEHATFGLSEVKRGLLPGGGGTLLATRVPLAIALELGLTGDAVDAERAQAVGLVNRVVPADRLLDEATALAARIAENGPLAVTAVKQLMRRGTTEGGMHAWPDGPMLRRIFGSADAREGATAFVERRAPRWTGR